jgi:O-antigen/teichoic acid export membrane protein
MMLMALPNVHIMAALGIDPQYIGIVILIMPAIALNIILPEALIAAGQSNNLAKAILFGSLARFPIFFGTIYILNTPVPLGTLIAYSSYFFITPVLCWVFLSKILFHERMKSHSLRSDLQHILEAGLASWIPTMVNVLGSQLGIIIVFVTEGAAEAGKFYLPLTIFTIVLFIVNSINRVSHPMIAGMSSEDEQRKFVSYSMKLAYVFTLPLAVPILFFAESFLKLVGSEFGPAGNALTILMVALPLAIVSEILYYFVYGKGDKRAVLYLGLAGNLTRIILYFGLVPIFGIEGAAFAYLAGTIVQLIFSVKVANKYSITLSYKTYSIISLIPLATGVIVWLANVQFVLATIIIIISSLFLYVRLHIITDPELRTIVYAALPHSTAKRIYPSLSRIMHRIS